jgi:micrococcal nuclease
VVVEKVSVYEYSCKIVKVVDGDTADVDIDLGFGVWLKKQRIRFYGIDTPESRTSDKVEKIYGLMAKDVVLHFLPVGSTQTLRTRQDDKGKYGRILGEFLIHDAKTDSQMTINDWMIREHHAVAYFGQSKEDIEDEHIVNRSLVESDKNI